MSDLTKFKMAMKPIPPSIETVIQQGVLFGSFPNISESLQVFENWPIYANKLLRAKDGRLFVSCSTDMPNVSPEMIDWWFAWHMPQSERYQLWHPKAHLKSRALEERDESLTNKEKYISNISYVDEYIGKKIMYLKIAFFDPKEIGLNSLIGSKATAICARTSDRLLKADAGYLVHFVVSTTQGSQMCSVFWLGDINLHWPVVGKRLNPLISNKLIRKLLLSDKMATDLLRHCAEEMNHLARFLPSLYQQYGS